MFHFSLSSRDNGLLSSIGSPQDCLWTRLYPFGFPFLSPTLQTVHSLTILLLYISIFCLVIWMNQQRTAKRVYFVAKLGMRRVCCAHLIKQSKNRQKYFRLHSVTLGLPFLWKLSWSCCGYSVLMLILRLTTENRLALSFLALWHTCWHLALMRQPGKCCTIFLRTKKKKTQKTA